MGQCGDQGCRGDETGQSRGVRQQPSSGREADTVDRISLAGPEEGTPQADRQVVPFLHGGIPEEVPGCSSRNQPGGHPSLPAQTWRSNRRPDLKDQGVLDGQGERTLEDRCQCKKICQDRKSSTTVMQTEPEEHAVLHLVRKEHPGGVPGTATTTIGSAVKWDDVFARKPLPRQFALELFSGSARLSQSVRAEGLEIFPIDICMFPSHNVLLPQVEKRILSWLERGKVSFIWIGMPCTTFSQARKFDGLGPTPLRTVEYLWGLPQLSSKDRFKVTEGNMLLALLLRILRACEAFNIPYVVENPLSSMLWMMPTMVEFCNVFHPTSYHLDFCAFGEQWKKPTTLMTKGFDLGQLAKRCRGSRNICSYTNCQHIPLRGRNADGIFWTLVAQPYPWSMCKCFAVLARAQTVAKG